jgi:G3E family GTPase
VSEGLDFLVLTGFLGSGKTTLLRDFLLRPDSADTAVIVNEVGEIGLDGAILRESSGAEVKMALLSNGCVCCSMGSTLATTVEALLHADRPGGGPLRRIVLETSGLSKPGPVLRQLAQLGAYRMRVGVVATYDCERADATAEFAEAVSQWAGAGTIVVTKADRVAPEVLSDAAAEAGRINPLARIIATADRDEVIRQIFDFPPGPASFTRMATRVLEPAAHPDISVFLVRTPEVVAYDDLAAWLDNLGGLLGERLLRVKGLVRVAECEQPLLVQSVGTLFSAPRPFAGGAESGSFLVIIGSGIIRDEILSVTPDLSLVV